MFWQTYGATVATPQGCDWNINQDYFVPRHCDSGRYDLLSACKTLHTRSAACKNLHPLYSGYCTPYGACRYRWRDHVYKVHCGCTPLKCEFGPWHLDRCRKHLRAFKLEHRGDCCPAEFEACALAELAQDAFLAIDGDPLPNVEPLGGVLLGSIAALPAGSGSAGGPSAAVGGLPAPAAATQSILPSLGLTPPATAPAKGALSPVSSF
ncbi:MAG: hypothetical protein DCC67_18045 [Planctomycetota bacterium]|nr:MAG: hypothetical protein DCC67_18045 [Planctomycetota bacterium]